LVGLIRPYAHQRKQFVDVNRLGNVIVGAGIDMQFLIAGRCLGSQRDDPQLANVLIELRLLQSRSGKKCSAQWIVMPTGIREQVGKYAIQNKKGSGFSLILFLPIAMPVYYR
jgi:hypothetical protein